jgi:hypothetical protein
MAADLQQPLAPTSAGVPSALAEMARSSLLIG